MDAYYVRCGGKCILPCKDIIEVFKDEYFECEKYIDKCKKRKHGYKCCAEIWQIYEVSNRLK